MNSKLTALYYNLRTLGLVKQANYILKIAQVVHDKELFENLQQNYGSEKWFKLLNGSKPEEIGADERDTGLAKKVRRFIDLLKKLDDAERRGAGDETARNEASLVLKMIDKRIAEDTDAILNDVKKVYDSVVSLRNAESKPEPQPQPQPQRQPEQEISNFRFDIYQHLFKKFPGTDNEILFNGTESIYKRLDEKKVSTDILDMDPNFFERFAKEKIKDNDQNLIKINPFANVVEGGGIDGVNGRGESVRTSPVKKIISTVKNGKNFTYIVVTDSDTLYLVKREEIPYKQEIISNEAPEIGKPVLTKSRNASGRPEGWTSPVKGILSLGNNNYLILTVSESLYLVIVEES